jgi:hypothetical protein
MRVSRQRYIVYSQLSLFLGLLICIFIKPKGLGANAGISYYGTFLRTVLPYTVGILGGSYYCYRFAQSLLDRSLAFVRNSMITISIMSIGIVLTPYSINSTLDWMHTTFGTIIFILELIISAWVIIKLKFNSNMLMLWIIELICGIAAAIYTLPPQGFLIQSQILFQLTFGIILYLSFDEHKKVFSKQLVQPY